MENVSVGSALESILQQLHEVGNSHSNSNSNNNNNDTSSNSHNKDKSSSGSLSSSSSSSSSSTALTSPSDRLIKMKEVLGKLLAGDATLQDDHLYRAVMEPQSQSVLSFGK